MILITGAARSGTSLTTQILQRLGAHLGPAHDINALYENTALREGVLKPFLRRHGYDPKGQWPLPPAGADCVPDNDFLGGLSAYWDAHMHPAAGQHPAYKDAKLALCWGAWNTAMPGAKWVIVRRNGGEIADSCMRTGFMTAYDNHAGWIRWVEHHERQFLAMRKAGLDVIETWPADFIKDPEAFRPVADFCGLPFDADAVRGAIDPAKFKRA